MSGSHLRLLISLLVACTLALAGLAHAPMAAAQAVGAGGAAAPMVQPPCHGDAAKQAPASTKAHQTLDCCLMLCSSLPATTSFTTRPVEYAGIGYPMAGALPLVPRTVSPEPGPPRA